MVVLDAGVAGVTGVLGVNGIHVGVFGVRGQRSRGLLRPPSNNEDSEAFFGSDAVMVRWGGFMLDLSAPPKLGSVPERTSDLKAVKPGAHSTRSGEAGLTGGVGRLVTRPSLAEMVVTSSLAAYPGS